VYDSLYLALAELRTCRLVTADRTLINALKHGALAPRLCWVEDLAR
jgi:predicted nucleic acid-binding protein